MKKLHKAQASVIALALLTIAIIGTSALFLSLLSAWYRAYLTQENALQLLSDKGKENIVLTWKWDPPDNPNAYPIVTVKNDGTIGLKVIRVIFEEKVSNDITRGPYIIICSTYIDVGSTAEFRSPVKFNKNLYTSGSSRKLVAIVITERGNIFKSVFNEESPAIRAITIVLDKYSLYCSRAEINGFSVPIIGRLSSYVRWWRHIDFIYRTLGPLTIPGFWDVRNAEDSYAEDYESPGYRQYVSLEAWAEVITGRTKTLFRMDGIGDDREAQYWHVIRIIIPIPVKEPYKIKEAEVTVNYAVKLRLQGYNLFGGKFIADDYVYLMLEAAIASPLGNNGYTHGLRIGLPKQLAYLCLVIEGTQGKQTTVGRTKTFRFTPTEEIYVGDKLVLELIIYHRVSLDYEGTRSDVRIETLLKDFRIKLVIEELGESP